MGSKLSGTALKKLDTLEEARSKWDRIHSLLEHAAAPTGGRDQFLRQCRRAAEELARLLSGSGFGNLADTASQLAMLIGRTRNFEQRVGSIREAVAAVLTGIERAESAIHLEAEKAAMDAR
jgi:hypothetical protein